MASRMQERFKVDIPYLVNTGICESTDAAVPSKSKEAGCLEAVGHDIFYWRATFCHWHGRDQRYRPMAFGCAGAKPDAVCECRCVAGERRIADF